ncbi:MAG: VWA domain-containing protein [Planctomycetes bacterium]|nr:VWA domain-containing protein [Planctomycetota bacterium]
MTNGDTRTEITLADVDGSRLDRDIVVRWPVAATGPGVTVDLARPRADRETSAAAHGLLTVVPPIPEHRGPVVPRDLIMLIDTSGSMTGSPIEHAKTVARAVIASMAPHDRLEMIEFSTKPHRWGKRPELMDDSARASADAWVRGLNAGGCTEMTKAIYQALSPLRADAQRQVMLLTDGGIGFEHEVVAAVRRRLPAGSRVHVLDRVRGVTRCRVGRRVAAGGIDVVRVGEGDHRAQEGAGDPEDHGCVMIGHGPTPFERCVVKCGRCVRACVATTEPSGERWARDRHRRSASGSRCVPAASCAIGRVFHSSRSSPPGAHGNRAAIATPVRRAWCDSFPPAFGPC